MALGVENTEDLDGLLSPKLGHTQTPSFMQSSPRVGLDIRQFTNLVKRAHFPELSLRYKMLLLEQLWNQIENSSNTDLVAVRRRMERHRTDAQLFDTISKMVNDVLAQTGSSLSS